MENLKIGVGFGVMILRDGKVLLGQRHVDPLKADSELHGEGTWTMPGGKLHFGESFEQGACREIMEETGMRVIEADLKVISLSNDAISDAHFVTIGLLCERADGSPQVMEPDEITTWDWFSLDALPTPLFFPSERVVRNYQSGAFYTSEES